MNTKKPVVCHPIEQTAAEKIEARIDELLTNSNGKLKRVRGVGHETTRRRVRILRAPRKNRPPRQTAQLAFPLMSPGGQ